MGKRQRSPLTGYNHNFGHLGRIFHVQTEDSGPGMPRVFTHLFFEGTILVSRKKDYAADLPDAEVRALMRQQHKGVIRDLLQARLDERILSLFGGAPGADTKAAGLDAPAVAPEVAAAVDEEAASHEQPPDAYAGIVMSEGFEGSGAIVGSEAIVASETIISSEAIVSSDGSGAFVASEAIVAAEAIESTASFEPPAAIAVSAGALALAAEAAAPLASASAEQREPRAAAPLEDNDSGVPTPVSPRRETRPFATARSPASPPPSIVVREQRRASLWRGDPPHANKPSSGDAVVIQRSVIVGGQSSAPARPARASPSVPYVVTGSGGAPRSVAASAPGAGPGAAASAHAPLEPPRAVAPAPAPPQPAADTRRTAGAFGIGLPDDKSLDEVILEYLGEDGG